MDVIKDFAFWLNEEQERNFSAQLIDLIRKEVNVDIRDVRELLELGADPNYRLGFVPNEETYARIGKLPPNKITFTTPVMTAVEKESPEALRALIEYGANVNLRPDEESMTPIQRLAYSTDFFNTDPKRKYTMLKMFDMLVKAGADLSVVDEEGNTLLHIAAKNDPEKIPILLKYGLDPNIKNNAGEFPIDKIQGMRQYMFRGEEVNGSYIKKLLPGLVPDERKTLRK